jgi:predicted Zn-dependent peptidase
MTTKEKFEQLKALDIRAKSDAKRAALDIQFETLAKEDPAGFENAVMESAQKTLNDAKVLKIKEQISKISDIISMTYIAEKYFNKTNSWLSQRINEHEVNGKPAKFTPEEIDTLNFAFQDIATKIGAFRISC